MLSSSIDGVWIVRIGVGGRGTQGINSSCYQLEEVGITGRIPGLGWQVVDCNLTINGNIGHEKYEESW